MFTSDRKITEFHRNAYLWITLFTAIFGAVYEIFSHEVYSYFMIYAFLLPFAGGVIPLSYTLGSSRQPLRLTLYLYNSGIACLTVGCVFLGVLEIYGTSNFLSIVYFIAGIPLIICAAAVQKSSRGK